MRYISDTILHRLVVRSESEFLCKRVLANKQQQIQQEEREGRSTRSPSRSAQAENSQETDALKVLASTKTVAVCAEAGI